MNKHREAGSCNVNSLKRHEPWLLLLTTKDRTALRSLCRRWQNNPLMAGCDQTSVSLRYLVVLPNFLPRGKATPMPFVRRHTVQIYLSTIALVNKH